MSFKKSLKNLAALLAVSGGLASSASAQTVCIIGGSCECKFNWGTQNQICRSPNDSVRAINCSGIANGPFNQHVVSVSLINGVSASNIPMTAGGTLFPEACRASDSTRNVGTVFKPCVSALVPAKHRVLVG